LGKEYVSVDSAIIHIERKAAWGDLLRSYKIFLDEKSVGTIRQGMHSSFEVSAGRHEIFLTIDWCSSQRMSIDLAPGEKVKLICQARNAWLWVAFYNITFRANNYIKLSQEPFKDLIMS
jgi:hypothetical protein